MTAPPGGLGPRAASDGDPGPGGWFLTLFAPLRFLTKRRVLLALWLTFVLSVLFGLIIGP